MRLVGIWAAESKRDQTILKWTLYYSAVAMIIAIGITAVDFCLAIDDFHVSLSGRGCNDDERSRAEPIKILTFR